MKKFLRYFGLFTLTTLAVVFIAIGILINVVFTSDKLTPLVMGEATKHVKGELKLESVDLTFFSTIPYFSLDLHNGMLIDTTEVATPDTLLQFEKVRLSVNPIKFLVKKEVNVHQLLFSNATLFAQVNNVGQINWSKIIATPEKQEEEVPQDTTSVDLGIKAISIDQIAFENVNLKAIDEKSKSTIDIENFNAEVSCALSKEENKLELDLFSEALSLSQGNHTFANKIKTQIKADLSLIPATDLLQIHQMEIGLNRLFVGCAGNISKDSLEQTHFDLQVGLKIHSLEELLAMIPSHILQQGSDIQAKGDILSVGSFKGILGKNSYPILSLKSQINEGSFHYKGLPYGVDHLSTDLTTYIDLNEKWKSNLQIHDFLFKGANSTIQLKGEVNNMLVDPSIRSTLKAEVDFKKIAQAFPFSDSIKLGGILESDIDASLKVSDVMQSNYGKISLGGHLQANDVYLASLRDSFALAVSETRLDFGTNQKNSAIMQGKTLLDATCRVDSFRYRSKLHTSNIYDLSLSLQSSPLKDTTAIVSISTAGSIGHFFAKVHQGQQFVQVDKGEIKAALAPQKKDKKLAHITSNLLFDSVEMGMGLNLATLTKAGFKVDLQKRELKGKKWRSNGDIGFGALNIALDQFPLPISMPTSVLSMREDEIILHNAGLRIGRSDMKLTGKFWNLENLFFHQGDLKGKYKLSSNLIDCNEIIKALQLDLNPSAVAENEEKQEEKPVEEVAADSTATQIFVVPDKIDFEMEAAIKKVLFGKMEIDGIYGDIKIKNQGIQFNDVRLHTFAADMITTLVYQAKDSTSAYSGFDFKMQDIQVGKLVEFMPALDSLVPMLRSLDGIVNFHVAAETRFNPDFTPVIPSIQAAANLRGDSLVLMDGETFSEIAKMLRFKNKDKNVIDSVSVNLVVKDGEINIFPFLISMDRYTAAVGGRHNLDMTFDYHVSLLDSPIPFNIGVDIKGNLDDFKFKIRRPKYKNLKHSIRTTPVDSTSNTLRDKIEVMLEKAYHSK